MSAGRRIGVAAVALASAFGLLGAAAAPPALAGPATHFAISAPATATAGTSFMITVTALDSGGAQDLTYFGTVHFASSDGQAALPTDLPLVTGQGTFSVTLRTAGNQTITATDTMTSSITGTSSPVAVAPAPATHFLVATPAQAAAGQPFGFTVTAQDQFNNTATGYGGTVHFTSTDGAAALPTDTTLSAGQGTLSATLNTAGSQTITATDTVSSSITGTSPGVSVSPAPTHFTITGPSSATAGGAVTLTVTASDSGDAAVPGYTGTVHFSSGDPRAVLPPDGQLVNGSGTFTATLETAGTQSITVTDTKTTSIAPGAISFPVSPAATSRFAVSMPATVTAGSPLRFTITAQDPFGNATPAYAGTLHFTSTDHAASLPGDSKLTGGAGTFSATLTTAGMRTITATDSATSSITGTGTPITVSPGAAVALSVIAPATATAGRPFTVTITALDPFANTATGYARTVSLMSSDPAATLPANIRLAGGTGSFTITLRSGGIEAIIATDAATGSLTGSATVSVAGSAVASFLVGHGKQTTLSRAGTFTVPGLQVRCPAGARRGCRVTGSAVLASGQALDTGRRGAPKPLATVSMSIGRGTAHKIVMKLTPAGAAKLRAAGQLRLKARLTATVVGGSGTSLTRVFTLR